jgi:hypothetical protein
VPDAIEGVQVAEKVLPPHRARAVLAFAQGHLARREALLNHASLDRADARHHRRQSRGRSATTVVRVGVASSTAGLDLVSRSATPA